MRAPRNTIVALFALVVLLGATGPALADVHVDVSLIEATKGPEFVDPKLQDLASHFKRLPGFDSFRSVKQEPLDLKLNESGSVAFPGGETLKLTYRGTSKQYVKLRFVLGDMQMNIRLHDGGVFFHSGVPHGEGRIVVAIKATEKP